jgi:predicted metal-dependent hydrolase
MKSSRLLKTSVTTERHFITVQGMPVEVVRKNIKHLHLAVYPPDGRVRVSVPVRLTDEDVRLAVISRLGWIRRRQEMFQSQERQSAREFVSGESHFVQGRRYRLDVIEENGPAAVRLRNNSTLELRVRPGTARDKREEILNHWYRELLKNQIAQLLPKWEKKIGVTVSEWGVRKMKTRWGTCNIEARRIWVNLELAKKPPQCLEYIMVHEMVHLLERRHNDRFLALMDKHLPNWRHMRDELNREPLAHEHWVY